MFHPHTELRFVSPEIGYGVFATRPIPRGTITWAQDALDQVFPTTAVEGLSPLLRHMVDKYCFTDRRGKLILCWDNARFVNHSCDATCLSPGGFDFEIAIRDIAPGQELTDDYGTLNLDHPFRCLCGSPLCRGTIQPDDPHRLFDWWDQRVARAFPDIGSVEQPLMELVNDQETLRAALAGREPLRSSRMNIAPRLHVARAG